MTDLKNKLSSLQNGSDIRGIAMEGVEGEHINLDEEAVQLLSYGFVKWLSIKSNKTPKDIKIAIGRDSRLSGDEILNISAEAMKRVGAHILDCSMASTPAMFMATIFDEINADGSIMITASHLPYNRNGMKFFSRDGGLGKANIKEIISYAMQFADIRPKSPFGTIAKADLMSLYADHLKKIIKDSLGGDRPLSNLSITVDAGNGAGGFFATNVLAPLGADISSSQFLEPDGRFPNHQPNPENKEAISSICNAVKATSSDLGIIFDTDVDRSSAVDSSGHEINRNSIIALAATLLKETEQNCTIVTDSTTSDGLKIYLEDVLGFSHLRYKRGYRNVIEKAQELCSSGENAALAIETSGHGAFKENYFLDDGAYLATKIVVAAAKLKKEGKGISDLIRDFDPPKCENEFRIKILSSDHSAYAQRIIDYMEENGTTLASLPNTQISIAVPNYEGIKFNFFGDVKGWILMRKSLHDPILVINTEADCPSSEDLIKEWLKTVLSKFESLDLTAIN